MLIVTELIDRSSFHGRRQDVCGAGAVWGKARSIGGRASGNRAYVLGIWGHVGQG